MSVNSTSSGLVSVAPQPLAGGAAVLTGQIGGRTAQATQPAAPRTSTATPGGAGPASNASPSFFSRLFGSSPAATTARADRKVREGQEAVGQLFSKITTELRSGRASPSVLVSLGNQLDKAAKPATTHGQSLNAVLSSVATGKLSSLDGAELVALQDAFGALDSKTLSDSPGLQKLKNQVDQQAAARERSVSAEVYSDLQPSLDFAIAQVTQQTLNGADCSKTFSMLRELASDALATAGYGHLPPEKFEKMLNVVLIRAIGTHIDPDATTAEQQSKATAWTSFITKGVSSDDMHSLLVAQDSIADEDVGATRNLITDSIANRAVQLETEVVKQLAAVGGSPLNLRAAVGDLKQVVLALGNAQKHAETHQLNMASINSQVKLLTTSLSTLTQADVLQLSQHELVDVLSSLKALGVEKLKGPLADTLRETVLGQFALGVQPAMSALARGDVEGLKALAEFTATATKDMELLLDGGDAFMELREQLMSSAFTLMAPDEFEAVARLAQSQEFEDITEALAATGETMLVEEELFEPGAGKIIFDQSIDLRMFARCADQKVVQDGLQIGKQLPTALLNILPSTTAVLAQSYGVIMAQSPNDLPVVVPVKTIGDQALSMLQNDLDGLVRSKSQNAAVPGYQCITADFAKDVTRAKYTWNDGMQQRDFSALEQSFDFTTYEPTKRTKDAIYQDADARLLQLTRGDKAKALNISRIFHQGLGAGMEHVGLSSHSPYLLSDGRIVSADFKKETNHFDVSPDGNGGFWITATSLRTQIAQAFETDDYQWGRSPNSNVVALNPDTSFIRNTTRLHMNANGDVILGTPAVTTQVSLQPT